MIKVHHLRGPDQENTVVPGHQHIEVITAILTLVRCIVIGTNPAAVLTALVNGTNHPDTQDPVPDPRVQEMEEEDIQVMVAGLITEAIHGVRCPAGDDM